MGAKETPNGPDAVDLMKKAPEKLLRMLNDRETVVIGTLASSESALVIERIRDQYKERVFRNVAYAIELLNGASYFINLLDSARGARTVDMEKVEKEHDLLSDYLIPYLNLDLRQKEALLTKLFKHLNPDARKVNVLISNITLRSMLTEMQESYKNLLETQKTKDGRAGDAYYLKDEFTTEWKRRARSLEERIAKDPFEISGYKEVAFYGLEERTIRAKAEIVDQLTAELKDLIARKAGKEALNRFHEKVKLRYLYMREMLIVVPAMNSETQSLIKRIVTSDNMPKTETLREWATK
ncbi:MAG TPA: hypothetical protein VNF06_01495 [Candidatus Aquilonibacter sp.]|nr:hypothetical protein [Candidatus Aquilonibacter sp.]